MEFQIRMPRPNWLYLPNMDCQNELIILAEDKTPIGEHLLKWDCFLSFIAKESPRLSMLFRALQPPIIRSSLIKGEIRNCGMRSRPYVTMLVMLVELRMFLAEGIYLFLPFLIPISISF